MLKIKVFNYRTGKTQEIALTPETSIQGESMIGRAPSCDVVLVSPEVSRVHGRINFQNEQYYFTDLCSTAGSRINTERVKANQSYVLQENDIIRIGGFVLVIAAVEIPASARDARNIGELDSVSRWTSDDLTVRCVGVLDETADVRTFCFVADPPVLFAYQPGQVVTLELEINGKPVRCSYFISSTPSRPHNLEITVKRSLRPTTARNGPLGLVSNLLHDHITIGSSVKLIGGPSGKFTCSAQPSQKLLMISVENGIIPLMSMSRWLYDTAPESDIVFFHSARTPRDIIFRHELELMASRKPNFHLAITTTHSEPGQAWLGLTGSLTEAMLLSVAPDIQERTVYVCGPDSFIQTVKAILESLAFPMQNYYSQSFGAAANTGKNAASTAVKELPIPSAELSTNERSGSEDPHLFASRQRQPLDYATTVLKLANNVTPQEDSTLLSPVNKATPQEDPTRLRPINKATPQEQSKVWLGQRTSTDEEVI